MGGMELKEGMYVYINMANSLLVQQKHTQHCKPIIHQ